MREQMKLELSVKSKDVIKILDIITSYEDLSKHLETLNISPCYGTIKDCSYNVSILAKDPAFIIKIVSILEEENQKQENGD